MPEIKYQDMTIMSSRLLPVLFISIILLINGCSTIPIRNPLPEKFADEACIPDIPRARMWGDETPEHYKTVAGQSREELRRGFPAIFGREHNYLAISGGGANGAFGAGLICGWSAAGTRPEFTMVTGVSTGALTAPFAFLGKAYDEKLREMYTTHSTKDIIFKRNIFNIITGSSAADTAPLKRLIAHYINRQVMEGIAHEYKRGRRLWIGTTNLDAKRPVIWNIGLIASSGKPGALKLIHEIILASASIPAAFPPVIINVEADGKRYDEIHVDGGTASQVFLYPPELHWDDILKKFEVKGIPNAYVIRNSFLKPDWKTVEPGIITIADVSIDSLIRTQGLGDMYRIYLDCLRDGISYNLAYIKDDFNLKPNEDFDPVYMGKLFDKGYNMAQTGYKWDKGPPGFE